MQPYAPPTAPIAPPAAPVSFEPSQRIAKVSFVALVTCAFWPLIAKLLGLAFGPSHGKRVSSSEYREIQQFHLAMQGLEALMFFVAVVLFMVWSHRFSKSAAARGGTSWTPGWTIGAWFVPLGNFILPYLVVRDLVNATRKEGGAWAAAWWILWIVTTVLNVADSFSMQIAHLVSDPRDLFAALYWVRSGAIIGTFACWAVVQCKLDRWSRTLA